MYFKQKDLFRFVFKNSVSPVRFRVYHTPSGRRFFLNGGPEKILGFRGNRSLESFAKPNVHVDSREKVTLKTKLTTNILKS